MKSVALIIVAILATGCARRLPPRATAADAERSNVSLAELEQGRKLVISRCGGSCHKPPLPQAHVAAQWPHALDEMAPRANLRPGERQLIEQYLVALSPAEH